MAADPNAPREHTPAAMWEELQALRRSEARLRDLVEVFSLGLCWLSEEGLILWANQAELDLLGCRLEDCINRPIAAFFAEPAVAQEMLASLRRGGPLPAFPARLHRPDGTGREVLIEARVRFENSAFVHSQCLTREVTGSRGVADRAPSAPCPPDGDPLLKSGEQFKALIQQAPVGICFMDSDLRLVHANPQALPTFGELGDPQGLTSAEILRLLVPAASAEHLLAQLRHTRDTGEPIHVPEFCMERIDSGKREYLEYHLHRIALPDGGHGVVSYFNDITAHVVTREALAGSEARLRFMAESMPQKIFAARPNGDVDYFNRQWAEFTGLSLEEIMNWGWTQFIHPDDLAENIRLWQHALATGEPFRFVHRFRRADGVYRWHLSRAQAMRSADGTITAWIGSNTEIHEEKEIAEDLRRANQDLNQFAFAASHDLQEPLRMITSYTQLLVKGLRPPLDAETLLCKRYIEDGTQRMREMLADLLSFTGTDSDGAEPFGPVDLNGVVARAWQNLGPSLEQSGALLTVPDTLPWVAGREAHFVQLFQNLLSNALKYRAPGRQPRVSVAVQEQPGAWRFTVSDNGIGIAPEYHRTVFGVFKRLHGSAIPGTGIGLALCQRVVERYQGKIWVESQPGSGASFYFTLPRPVQLPELAVRDGVA